MKKREQRQAITDAYIKLDSEDSGERYIVNNISRGGLRFSSHNLFEIHARVGVTVYLANDIKHQAKGRICYFETNTETSDGDYYGLSFLDNYLKID